MDAEGNIGRRDLLSMLMYLIAVLLGRVRVPARLASFVEEFKEPLIRAVARQHVFKLTTIIKGFEVSDEWYRVLREDPELQRVVREATGLLAEKA